MQGVKIVVTVLNYKFKLLNLFFHFILATITYLMFHYLAETIFAIDAMLNVNSYLQHGLKINYNNLSDVFRKFKLLFSIGMLLLGLIPFILKEQNCLKFYIVEFHLILIIAGIVLLALFRHYSFIWIC